MRAWRTGVRAAGLVREVRCETLLWPLQPVVSEFLWAQAIHTSWLQQGPRWGHGPLSARTGALLPRWSRRDAFKPALPLPRATPDAAFLLSCRRVLEWPRLQSPFTELIVTAAALTRCKCAEREDLHRDPPITVGSAAPPGFQGNADPDAVAARCGRRREVLGLGSDGSRALAFGRRAAVGLNGARERFRSRLRCTSVCGEQRAGRARDSGTSGFSTHFTIKPSGQQLCSRHVEHDRSL
ncbi:hypothetical protein GN956_G11584 [Arapaima gigas]